MKNILLKILGILLLVLLELTIISKISLFGSIPNVIFLLSIVLVVLGFFQDALLIALIGGIILDLTSPFRFGIYTLYMIAVLLLLNFVILKNLPGKNPFWIFSVFLSIFILFNLLIMVIIKAWPDWEILVDAFINSLWGICIYFIARHFLKTSEEIKII